MKIFSMPASSASHVINNSRFSTVILIAFSSIWKITARTVKVSRICKRKLFEYSIYRKSKDALHLHTCLPDPRPNDILRNFFRFLPDFLRKHLTSSKTILLRTQDNYISFIFSQDSLLVKAH